MKAPLASASSWCAWRWASLPALVVILSFNAAGATNVLTNPGFETGSLSGWTTIGPNNSIQSSAGMAHGGVDFYKVYGQFNAAYNYTGIYQDNASGPGVTYLADGWAFSLGSDGGGIHGQDQIWLEVSFRDASYNALALYRSSIVSGANLANIAGFNGTNVWFDLQITNQCSFTNASGLILFPGTVTNTVTNLVAPAGTVYARYQAVFVQGPDNANGSMYFDDLTLNQTGGTVAVPPTPQWNIVWSDEFNGNSINTANWTFENGNNRGWGNNELEYYTGRSQNAYVSNGLLHIVAQREYTNGYFYTSARMKTQNLFTETYGRFQWRAATPAGTGMWPALWMLGANFPSAGWPACGEIDVMENNGASPGSVQSSLHSGSDETGHYPFQNGDSVTNFHIYEVDWQNGSISFSVDGNVFESQSGWSSSIGAFPAPFNAPFFLIMNLAVGGNYVGNPSTNSINAGAAFPAEVQVDYVRVYEQTAPLALSIATQLDGSLSLSWPTGIVCHLQSSSGLSGANWSDVAGATNPFSVIPDPNSSGLFYRLLSP
jgi:beta-glucanase (GH16 family)